jgi:hypothetical protein
MSILSRKNIISFNRKLGWVFTLITITMLSLGYLMTRIDVDKGLYQPIHIYLGYIYGIVVTIHILLSKSNMGFPWKSLWHNPDRLFNEWTITRVLQRLSAWVLLLASLFMVGTGLGWDKLILWKIVPFTFHVQIDQVITIMLVIHLMTGMKSVAARNKISFLRGRGMFFISLILVVTAVFVDTSLGTKDIILDENLVFPESYTDQNNTLPKKMGKFRIGRRFSGNSRVYEFNPVEVETLRPDIFREGYFSVFDVLVHVAERGDFELDYHFEESLNTYVIDHLEGAREWWYEIYFDAGWPEGNFYRMDHFPWKDGSYLTFFEVTPERIESAYSFFQKEIKRLERNDGQVIIPIVYITGIIDRWEFENVTVSSHNLRVDMFQNDTITAIDVILSLGDQGMVNYTLQWYESIGEARIVKSFWVENLMGDRSRGRCGFVHEEGNLLKGRLGDNHIHLPADVKVLNSPDYAWWFYMCV